MPPLDLWLVDRRIHRFGARRRICVLGPVSPLSAHARGRALPRGVSKGKIRLGHVPDLIKSRCKTKGGTHEPHRAGLLVTNLVLVGPVGPPGPDGPDVEDVVADLDTRMSDLEDYVCGTFSADLESQLSDLEDTVSSICDEMSYSSISALNDIYFVAC